MNGQNKLLPSGLCHRLVQYIHLMEHLEGHYPLRIKYIITKLHILTHSITYRCGKHEENVCVTVLCVTVMHVTVMCDCDVCDCAV